MTTTHFLSLHLALLQYHLPCYNLIPCYILKRREIPICEHLGLVDFAVECVHLDCCILQHTFQIKLTP
jgi:hypothetical protein